MGFTFCVNPGIYLIENKVGAVPKLLSKDGFDPQFIGSDRILFQSFEGEDKTYKSISIDGKDIRTHFTSKYATSVAVSPDGNWVAFIELFKAYVAAFPKTGKPLELSANMGSVPVTQIAKDAGLNIHWSKDSKKIHWTYSDEYFTNTLKDRFTFMEGSPEKIAPMDSVGIKINLEEEENKSQSFDYQLIHWVELNGFNK